MARKFNLQPWREQRRAQQKQNFIFASVAVVFLCLAAFGADYWLQTNHIDQQRSAIRLLNDGITRFNKTKQDVERVKKLNDEVSQQISVIQELQAQRGLATEILNYIALNTPDTVFLSAIHYKNGQITIDGVAKNDSGVSAFLRNMEQFQYFPPGGYVNYSVAKSNQRYLVDDNTEVKQFTITLTVQSKLQQEDQ